MAYRLKPGQRISLSVSEIGTDQIDRVLKQFAGKANLPVAVHDARKAMKRLRALLHMVRPALEPGDFRRQETRLKQIARSLAGARDAQAMLDTVAKLETEEGADEVAAFSKELRARLEEQRSAAEAGLKRAGVTRLRKQLREARDDFAAIALTPDDFSAVAETLKADYAKARRRFKRAYASGEDEIFHDWRKYVQRHWRQLLLIAPSWPKAIRPHVALARELSEVLGEDHDISVLAELATKDLMGLAESAGIEDFLTLARRRQQKLRAAARPSGARLLAERPRSFSRRICIYWDTATAELGEEAQDGEKAA